MPRRAKNTIRRVIRSPSLGSHSDASETREREQSQESRPSTPPPSDHEVFQRSDTPEEDWGEEEEDAEWPVKAIVGQEILANREIRYQVEWEGWQRADGTSTTWTIGLPGANNLIKRCDERRAEEKRKAAKSPEISTEVLDEYKPHNIRTAEDAVAYYEKFEKHRAYKDLYSWDEWLGMDNNANGEEESDRHSSIVREVPKKRKRQESTASTSASGSRASGSRLPGDDSTFIGSPTPSSSSKRSGTSFIQVQKSQFRSLTQSQKLAQPREVHTPIHRPTAQFPKRRRLQAPYSRLVPQAPKANLNLQRQWEENLKGAGAAGITIVNEIDEELFPPVPPNFQYLEKHCNYDVDVSDPRRKENKLFMIGCECEGDCDDVELCSCLMESQCINEYEEPAPAYDEKGFFLFNNQREVVECNENCACNRRCNNTVAQKPRKIPIEVFKTAHNGWGARSAVRIKSGTVLGFYTGKIIKRDRLSDLTQEERDYTFDLDIRDDEPGLGRYTVCAYNEGNWTRFVNHSCSPNTVVYSVVFDAPVEANMPYIAFVAMKDIPPKTEITVDYNPSAARAIELDAGRKKKGKGKKKAVVKIEESDVEMEMEDGRTRCMCGSKTCRGFI